MKIIRITPSFVLRELQLDDATAIFRALDTQREHFGRWLPFVATTRTVEDSRAFVQEAVEGPELVFSLRVDDVFIGIAGFKETAIDDSRTEIGYWMREDYQGRGLMTAAVRELVRFAMEEQGIGEVFIKCAVGNERSRNIPLRLGFDFREVQPRGEYVAEGVFRAVEVYSLKKI